MSGSSLIPKQTKNNLALKAIIWRLFIAIPFGLFMTQLYLDDIYKSIEMTIAINIVSTILYYIYDLVWFKYVHNKIKDKYE